MSSKRITLIGGAFFIGVLLIVLTAGTVVAQRSNPWHSRDGYGRGTGMTHAPVTHMGDSAGVGGMGYGPAPVHPQEGFDWGTCHSGGMMGDWEPGDGARITSEDATEAVQDYLVVYGDPDLIVAEVMEFTGNFYFQIAEESTGIGAFELLVNPFTGAVYPEPGPNMMWNTKYGHMSNGHMGGWGGMLGGFAYRAPGGEVSVSPEEAIQAAQIYLDRVQPGLVADDHGDEFYGYYTLHVLEGGQVVGMLSVHGTTGQVWYHAWHGDFIGMTEAHE